MWTHPVIPNIAFIVLLQTLSFFFASAVVSTADGAVQTLNSANIQDAIRLWQSNPTEAEERYGGPIEDWDTSNVTSLRGAFLGCENFAADLSKWNVSAVTNMEYIFFGSNFSGNMSAWDTSRVTSLSRAFYKSENFTSDVSQWNVSAVMNMASIFPRSKNFSGNVSAWDTSRVTSLWAAFYESENFTADVSHWNVSAVTNMEYIFRYSKNFSGNVSAWDTSRVTSLHMAFHESENFKANVSKWNVSAVTNMEYIFLASKNFSGNVSTWDTSRVIWLSNAFSGVENFVADVSKWNVSAVTSMVGIFQDSTNFASDISTWDTSNVKDYTETFFNASWFNTTICWDLTSADPDTLTQFSCHSKGGLDCSCGSLDSSNLGGNTGSSTATARSAPTNAPVNLCNIINSQCPDSTPPCILSPVPQVAASSVVKSLVPNFCAVDNEKEEDGSTESDGASAELESSILGSSPEDNTNAKVGNHGDEEDFLKPPCIMTNPKAPNFCAGQGSMGIGMAEEGNLDPSGDPSFGVPAKAFLLCLGLLIIAVFLEFHIKRRFPLLLAPPGGSPPRTESKELELVGLVETM